MIKAKMEVSKDRHERFSRLQELKSERLKLMTGVFGSLIFGIISIVLLVNDIMTTGTNKAILPAALISIAFTLMFLMLIIFTRPKELAKEQKETIVELGGN